MRQELITEIIDSIRLIKRHLMASHIQSADITPVQWEILRRVLETPDQGISDLANVFVMSNSAMTQHVNLLVHKGLLERRENPDDRRQVKIAATKVCREKANRIRSTIMEQTSALFEVLTTEELFLYVELQRKVTNHLSAL